MEPQKLPLPQVLTGSQGHSFISLMLTVQLRQKIPQKENQEMYFCPQKEIRGFRPNALLCLTTLMKGVESRSTYYVTSKGCREKALCETDDLKQMSDCTVRTVWYLGQTLWLYCKMCSHGSRCGTSPPTQCRCLAPVSVKDTKDLSWSFLCSHFFTVILQQWDAADIIIEDAFHGQVFN